VKVPDYQHYISYDQKGSYGQAGYNGLIAAYAAFVAPFPSTADPTNPIVRFHYTSGDESTVAPAAAATQAYIANILMATPGPHTFGIMLSDTYGPGADYITQMIQWQYANDSQQASLSKASRLTLYFSNLSFVGPDSLASRLVSAGMVTSPSGATIPFTQNVVVSQVVPNYQNDMSGLVVDYRAAIAAANATPTFTSLEGYIDARIFISGLLANTGPFTPDSLVSAFEGLSTTSLGLGAASGFSATSHEYSRTVWGTSIQSDGTFKNLYYFTHGQPIMFFQ
jgi:hypothetical protein